MGEKKIIIIGAGLAGLSAGCYARMNGFRTRIFELHSLPGGVCTSWKREGYHIDGCIHWLMGIKEGSALYRFYNELGIIQAIKIIEIADFGTFMDEATGKTCGISADSDELRRKFLDISPEDREKIDELIENSKRIAEIDMGFEGEGLIGGISFMIRNWRGIRAYFKYGLPIEDYARGFKSEWLGTMIRNLFVRGTPAFFIMMTLGFLFKGQLGMVEGGSLKFVLPIEKTYKKLGGEIDYESPVEKILVENGSAVGVRLADGTEYRADIVVSACDLHSTLYDMLGSGYAPDSFRKMFETWKMFEPVIIASFGVKGEIAPMSHLNVIFLKEPFHAGNRQVNRIVVRDFSYDKTIAGEGKTVVQVELETEYGYWSELARERGKYDAEKMKVAEMILSRLEPYYPGIGRKVGMIDVATPYTFYRYTRNYRGAFEGWVPNAESVRKPVSKTIPGLRNFYLCGQWVEPGGGVPTAIWSGRKAVKLICKDNGRKFVGAESIPRFSTP